MKSIRLKRKSFLTVEEIFSISVDISNFHLILPKYFESLKIIKDQEYEKIVIESITFLGFSTKVKTKHVILPPNLHHVYILSGPLRGTSFIESYMPLQSGTEIIIDVSLKFFGIFNGFNFLNNYVIKKMFNVMNEFVTAVESKIASGSLN